MARKTIAILILLTLAAGYAHAIGVGGEGIRFGKLGATAGKAIVVPPPPGCASPTAPNGVMDFSVCSNIAIINAAMP